MFAFKNWEEWNGYLEKYLQNGNRPKFRSAFFQSHFMYQVAFFNQLHTLERISFYEMIHPEEFCKIFNKLEDNKQKKVIKEWDDKYVINMMDHMRLDQLIQLLRKLTKQDRDYYMAFLKKTKVRKIKIILSYEMNRVGSMMTMEYITANPNELVRKVLHRVKKAGRSGKSIDYVYVVSTINKLIGVVSLRSLLIARADQTMRFVMKEQVITTRIDAHKIAVEKIVNEYGLKVIPVVSKSDELLGIVIVNDVEHLMKIRKSYFGTKNNRFSRFKTYLMSDL